ncbi:MAG TPA: DNA gyrase subunit A [candidate division Zixibacteria bacterium]|nr:DNA gyrase subunit A [candidate division Zixibacteria bacterium]MDM7973543.1 DNA gyrase subunit A [candidate division Zixibacteria bacterium]HOD65947.1 DNA gyrase subunit A [candidate division Zixibacteria bacterium]HPM37941.1 DNA gyrase subunit A [candidate division Zixibacteria bacterium]
MERQKIETIFLEEEMKHSYLDYSMSVITNRALPDIRDGLKPSNRRILVAMNDLNLAPGRPHRKCAKICGDTSGNYHPHGEQVVYPTLVRMAQDFNMRYPLVDGQGNFGSIDGDGAAAMRYTEARLTPMAMEMLDDLKKETVDFMPNYDSTREEPVVLPAKFPNLLCNGTSGIAVGMATNIPPHNLNEIAEAIIRVIDDPECTNDDLMEIVPGPDFPTGGIINGRDGIREAYRTGKGHVYVRARAAIERMKNGKDAIIVSEIPFQVNKTNLLEKIAELVRDKKIDGIADLRDESDRDGMRIFIELKRDIPPDVVLNQLFTHTTMQTTFSVNMLGLDHGVPKQMSLKQLIRAFVDHRHEVVVRRTQYDLRKAEERAHILEGYRIALDHIDEVIALIRKSKDTPTAHAGLMKKFGLSDVQATAILEMRLQRLTGLERQKIEDEYRELIQKISEYRAILESQALRMQIVKDETRGLAEKYGDARRTEIQDAAEELSVEDLIAEEEMVITISHQGYVKRLSVSGYRRQQRGGMGVRGIETKEDDWAEHLFVASTHDYVLFFSNKGRCYWVKVHEIPVGGRLAKGKPIVNLVQMEKDENITAFTRVRDFSPDRFVVFATRQGVVKKVALDSFSHPRVTGVNAITLPVEDELIEACLSDGTYDIILATRKGMAIRFKEEKVRAMGRTAYGVKGITLGKKDYTIGMVVVKRDSTILTVCENGYGKRTSVDEYRITNRGGKGIINIKSSERNGEVVAIKEVLDQDELILITRKGVTCRTAVKGISVIGRNTQGVRLMQLRDDDTVIDVAHVVTDESQ